MSIKLKKTLSKFNFAKVFDLQNSSRTSFYGKFIIQISDWSSTKTTLKKGEKKKDFDKESVLSRFKIQLEKSNVLAQHCLKPDFNWASINVDKIVNKFFGRKFILIFPFCSPQLPHKKWPHFKDLIRILRNKHSEFEIAIAPNYSEILPSQTNTSIKLSKYLSLKIPILSSAMDTVTEAKMAIAVG